MYTTRGSDNAFLGSQQASPQVTPAFERNSIGRSIEALDQGGGKPAKPQPHTSTPLAPGDDEIEGEWAF